MTVNRQFNVAHLIEKFTHLQNFFSDSARMLPAMQKIHSSLPTQSVSLRLEIKMSGIRWLQNYDTDLCFSSLIFHAVSITDHH